jgi:hypothetical protein
MQESNGIANEDKERQTKQTVSAFSIKCATTVRISERRKIKVNL